MIPQMFPFFFEILIFFILSVYFVNIIKNNFSKSFMISIYFMSSFKKNLDLNSSPCFKNSNYFMKNMKW